MPAEATLLIAAGDAEVGNLNLTDDGQLPFQIAVPSRRGALAAVHVWTPC